MQESSGLHSLAALHEYERSQTQLQAELARARAEAEQRARIEAERDVLRAERERQRSEQAASKAVELARREELTRLDAPRAAELARAETARGELDALQSKLVAERDARRTAEIAAVKQLLRQRFFASIAGALCLAGWLGAAVLYFGSLRPEAERARLAEHSLLEERRARRDADIVAARLARRNEEFAQRVSSLESLANSLREQPAAAPPVLSHGALLTTHGSRRPQAVNTSQPPCRDDGDPLNPCLKTH